MARKPSKESVTDDFTLVMDHLKKLQWVSEFDIPTTPPKITFTKSGKRRIETMYRIIRGDFFGFTVSQLAALVSLVNRYGKPPPPPKEWQLPDFTYDDWPQCAP